MAHNILRPTEIAHRRRVSKSKLYEDIRQGLWAKLVAFGPRTRGQPESEVDEMIMARIAGKTDDEITLLVQRIYAARRSAGQGMGLPPTGAREKQLGLLGPHA